MVDMHGLPQHAHTYKLNHQLATGFAILFFDAFIFSPCFSKFCRRPSVQTNLSLRGQQRLPDRLVGAPWRTARPYIAVAQRRRGSTRTQLWPAEEEK